MDLLTANDSSGKYPPSYYAAVTPQLARFAPLQESTRCDVCVIGGGFTGLSAAWHLAQRGLDVVVLEAQRVGFGASGRNGGQAGSGQRVSPLEIERLVGYEHARAAFEVGNQAVGLIKDICARPPVDTPFNSGVVTACHRPRHVATEHRDVELTAERYQYQHAEPLSRQQLRDIVVSANYHGGSIDHLSGHVNPLALALGIAKLARGAGARIFEQSRARAIHTGSTNKIICEGGGEVSADYLIIATNGYGGNIDSEVAARVMPINNFIIATEPLQQETRQQVLRAPVAVADTRFVVNYFRLSDDNRLLFGGGESLSYRFPKDITALVRRPMLKVFPQLARVRIDYAWGGTLAITMKRLPYFRRLSGNVLTAGGYSGHGVALATFAGKLLSEAVVGQSHRFDIMARIPAPRFPGGILLRQPALALGMLWYRLRDLL